MEINVEIIIKVIKLVFTTFFQKESLYKIIIK